MIRQQSKKNLYFPKQYDAFISYSHTSDNKIAKAIQYELQTFAKPWWRLRAANIYRDETNLFASPNLWSDIKSELDKSSYFILLASPNSAGSKWVQKELCYWLSGGNIDDKYTLKNVDIYPDQVKHLLIVFTDGDFKWDDTINDFEFPLTTAIPVILKGIFTEEPAWVDLTHKDIKENLLDRKNDAFIKAIARLAAPIRSIPLAILVGQDYKEHRRTMRWVTITAITLLVLLIFALWSWYLAEDRLKIAKSSRLAIQSQFVGITNPDNQLLLSAESFETKPTVEAERALLIAIQHFPRLITIFRGHLAGVMSLAFTEDSKSLFSASSDHMIRRWDIETAEFKELPNEHEATINGIDFNKYREQLISVDADGVVVFRQLADNISKKQIKHLFNEIKSVAISSDGTTAATGDVKGNILIWNLPYGTFRRAMKAHNKPVFDLVFHPKNSSQLFSSTYGGVYFWDLSRSISKPRIFQHASPEQNWKLAIHPNGKQIVSCGEDGQIYSWPLPYSNAFDKPVRWFDNGCLSVVYSPDGRLLAAASSNGKISLKNLQNGKLETWQRHRSRVDALAFSPNSTMLASGGIDSSINLWDASNQNVLAKTLYSTDTGHTLFLGGSTKAILWDNNEISQWNLQTFSQSKIDTPEILGKILAITISKIPRLLYTNPEYFGSPVLEYQKNIDIVKVGASVVAAVWNDSGNIIAISDLGGTLKIYDANLKVLNTFYSQTGPIEGLSISKHGNWIVASKPYVRVWEHCNQTPFLTRKEMYDASAISPDGHWVALAKIKVLNLLNVVTGEIHTLDGSDNLINNILAFSPDSKRLASGGSDGKVYLWDVQSKQLISKLAGHDHPLKNSTIRRLLFTDDGHLLLSLGDDGRVLAWNMDAEKWFMIVRKVVNRK